MTPDAPKNESGLTLMVLMGESIRQIWVNVHEQREDLMYSRWTKVFVTFGKLHRLTFIFTFARKVILLLLVNVFLIFWCHLKGK